MFNKFLLFILFVSLELAGAAVELIPYTHEENHLFEVPEQCIDYEKEIPGWTNPSDYEVQSYIHQWSFDWDACPIEISGKDHYENYVVNLMWIFKKESSSETIFSELDPEKQVDRLLDWVETTGPKGRVYFWYDGAMVTPVAVQQTRKLLSEKIKERGAFSGSLQVRDLRSIPEIQENPFVFSSYIPVYYRSDLARLIVSSHLLNREDVDLIVYADIDMPAIHRDDMLDVTTVNSLQKLGYVFEGNPVQQPPVLFHIESSDKLADQVWDPVDGPVNLAPAPFIGSMVVGFGYENAFFILSSDVGGMGTSLTQLVDSYLDDFYQSLGVEKDYFGEVEIENPYRFIQHIYQTTHQRLLRNIISNEEWADMYFNGFLTNDTRGDSVLVPVKPVYNPHGGLRDE